MMLHGEYPEVWGPESKRVQGRILSLVLLGFVLWSGGGCAQKSTSAAPSYQPRSAPAAMRPAAPPAASSETQTRQAAPVAPHPSQVWTTDTTPVRSGPSTANQPFETLPRGTPLRVYSSQADWLFVAVPWGASTTLGWVEARHVAPTLEAAPVASSPPQVPLGLPAAPAVEEKRGSVIEPLEDIAQAASDRGDYATAFRAWRRLAEQGHAGAQMALGYMYHAGHGVPQDYAVAAQWYRRAAEQGHAIAQSNLCALYGQGRGVSQDYTVAAQWCRRAAEQGFVGGQINLGSLYENGHGVPRDLVLAYMWYALAALKPAEQGGAIATSLREASANALSRQQLAHAQQLVQNWKPGFTEPGEPARDAVSRDPAPQHLQSSQSPSTYAQASKSDDALTSRTKHGVPEERWLIDGLRIFIPISLQLIKEGLNVPIDGNIAIEEQLAIAKRWVQREPKNAEAYATLGATYLQIGRLDEAIIHLRKAVAIDPKTFYGSGYPILGTAYFKKGMMHKALEAFEHALNLMPHIKADREQTMANLGTIYLRLGKLDKAIQAFMTADKAYNNLGVAFIQKGRLDEAIAMFQKALDGKDDMSNKAYTHNNLGFAYLRKGLMEEAQRALQRARQLQAQ